MILRTWLQRVIWILPLSLFGSLFSAGSISISSNPSPMSVTSAVAGADPDSVTDSSTTYTLSNDNRVRVIRARVLSSLPAGVDLLLELDAPSGAVSLGAVSMGTSYHNLVTGVPKFTRASGLGVNYTLAATAAAAPTSGSVVVTLNIN